MYKALHSYVSGNIKEHTLAFTNGETLCILEKTNSSWWLASNENGFVGYIPKSYVQYKNETKSDDVLLFIEHAIAAVLSRNKDSQLTDEEKSLLKKLNNHKDTIISMHTTEEKAFTKRKAPPPPPEAKKECEVLPCPNQSRNDDNPCPLNQNKVGQVSNFTDIPSGLGQSLVDIIQQNTYTSFTKSRNTLKDCLALLGQSVSSLATVMDEIIKTLPDETVNDPDMETLGLAFANLVEIKDDVQQRNWAIDDDETKISQILSDILHVLTEGNKVNCISEMSKDQFLPILTLASFYQMETRTKIITSLLQIVGVVCSLSPKFISVLLSTTLPTDLASDVSSHTTDVERTCYTALVLSMLFSTGEPIPFSYYETIGEDFASLIINHIESKTGNEELTNIFVRLLLSINLHFAVPTENLVLHAVKKTACWTFSEKIMLLCNRGDDPTVITEDVSTKPSQPHSVLKFLQDIFSCKETACSFLYTNDLLVLFDILLRNIADLASGTKVRAEYLDLLLCVIRNSTYLESNYRLSEIVSVLHRIQQEDTEEHKNIVEFDKKIVCSILSELAPFL